MAGLRGNIGWILAAKQTSGAKGTLATIASGTTYKNALVGGGIGPKRDTDHLQETDSSRDIGVIYTKSSGVEGSPEFYARDASAGAWLYWALGAVATTGTTNLTHTITPANTLPYISVWRNVGDTLWESYQDCKVGSLNIKAEAGSPLSITAGIQGLVPTRLTATPDSGTPISVESSHAYNYNDGTITLSSGATALVRSFDLTIENNLQLQQTDNVVPYDVYEGQRQVSLGFDLIFESLVEYNQFHYGGASGTAVSANTYTTDATFQFDNGANNQIKFALPAIAYEEFPVDLQPNGDPVTVSVRAVAQRSGSPVLTATVKNQVTAY